MVEFVNAECRLHIHATPGARQDKVGGAHDGALRVSVTAPADKGRANKQILKLLAKSLQLKPHQLQLARGQTSRRKTVLIVDPPPDLKSRVEILARVK